jgi:hypothetical protein
MCTKQNDKVFAKQIVSLKSYLIKEVQLEEGVDLPIKKEDP